jgi:hypothetical protein
MDRLERVTFDDELGVDYGSDYTLITLLFRIESSKEM